MLRGLSYKGVYKSDMDHILEDFYFPTLSVATRYDRAVGFFSASTISYAAQALSVFVKHGGQIRLILGAFSDHGDLEAVKQGYREKGNIAEKIGGEFLSMISNVSDELFQNRLETLSWLVAHGRLDVKIALRERGMYHDKVGIITDEVGDRVVFSGSANESTHALLPTHNYESINVFRTWVQEHAEFYNPHIESFERLWKDESHGTVVIDIPTAVRDKLISVARSLDYTPDPEIEAAIAARILSRTGSAASTTSGKPHEPTAINGQPFKMRDHQIAALRAWMAHDFQGTFDLATGAGKTITAIHATVKLSEKIDGLACVIAAPYQNLADQWVEILSTFNIYPVKCYISRTQWEDKLRNMVHELAMGSRSFGAIVVVNRTLKSPEFQECLSKINGGRLLWIGDECHHHTSKAYEGFLPEHARFRIGLSATPQHYLDEERNERLNEFYGDIVSRYTLRQAIEDKVLTPYVYYPHLVEFTEDEAEEFVDLSEQIGRIMARQNGEASEMSAQLTGLLMRRARLVGSAANKLPMLQAVLVGKQPTQHTLFYCGDGSVETNEGEDDSGEVIEQGKRQVEAVSTMLHRMSWDVSRFTSRESRKDRDNILENFRLGLIDAMVAIRCLDEGIDVPACSTAYILASSRDPRQFVQRRGRILRRSPGKERALIHDFIVVLPQDFDTESEYAKRLIKSELVRVAEFSSLSDNRSQAYENLAPVLKAYDLEHMV